MPVVPDSLVRLLADVSDPRRLAVVAQLDNVHGGDVVALGHLAVIDDDYAELGLVVADAWQRQGIGTALARKLIDAGAAHGYRRFVAFGLSTIPGGSGCCVLWRTSCRRGRALTCPRSRSSARNRRQRL